MSSPGLTLRRATLDDLSGLKALWERAGLPVLELEKHFTDFQVVVDESGELAAAIGLRIAGKEGLLHGESCAQAGRLDEIRPLLWERAKTVARNHGLVRLWTREAAPFWSHNGFAPAEAGVLKHLPAGFGDPKTQWLMLQLREESLAAVSLEKELEMFQQSQQAESARLIGQAKWMKAAAYVLAIGALILVVIGGLNIFRKVKEVNISPPTAGPTR